MKKGFLVLLIGILYCLSSCTDKCHTHFYKVYNGVIDLETTIISSSISSGIGICKFNKLDKKYFINDFPRSQSYAESIWVYHYKVDSDTFIIPINSKIGRYHRPATSESFIEELTGKGSYGCIPKFREDNNGNLLYNNENGKKVLPLLLGNHLNIVANDSIILVLTPHYFHISDKNYTKLDSVFKTNKNLQGGIYKAKMTDMKIYNENDVYQFTVDNIN